MDLILLLIGLLLILGTGFFVAVEFSLVALEAATVQQAKDSGDKAADAVLRCLKTLSTQLSSCQIGITITTLLTGYTLDAAIKALTTDAIGSLGLPSGLIDVLTLVLAMLIATLLSMVMGELLPKGLAIADPYNVARRLAPFQLNFTRIISPLVRIMNGSANWILGRFGMEAKEELSAARTPDELSSMVRRSAKEGTLDSAVARFLDRTLRFSELTASEVMTPRGQVSMLEDTTPVSDIIELARSTGHSRFPLYKGDHDNIVGVVHVKKAVGVPPKCAAPSRPARSPKTFCRSPRPCTWTRCSPSCAREPCSLPWSSTSTAEPRVSQRSKTSLKKSSAKSPTNTTADAPSAPCATATATGSSPACAAPTKSTPLFPDSRLRKAPSTRRSAAL